MRGSMGKEAKGKQTKAIVQGTRQAAPHGYPPRNQGARRNGCMCLGHLRKLVASHVTCKYKAPRGGQLELDLPGDRGPELEARGKRCR
jgi:hypothetical protein